MSSRRRCRFAQLAVHPLFESGSGMRSNDPRDVLPVVQKNKRGNPADAKPMGNIWRRVGVYFYQLQAAGPLLCDLLHDGRHDSARAAPGSPEIDEDRERALLDDRRIVGLATF